MKYYRYILTVLCVVFLSSCVHLYHKAQPVPANMAFENYPIISIDAANIEVRNDYRMPMFEPNVEHLFPIPLYIAVKGLIDNSLLALGDKKILKVIIDEASVVSEPVPIDISFWGNFKKEPVEILKAKVSLRFELVAEEAPDIILGYANIISKRNKTLMEDMSNAARDRAYYDLTEELLADINKGMQDVVKKNFSMNGF